MASNPHLGSDFDDFLREEGLYEEAQVMGALRSAPRHAMLATLTSKGQVTIPKRIRDALHFQPGAVVEFSVNAAGEVVLHRRRPADQPTMAARARTASMRYGVSPMYVFVPTR